MKILKRLIGRIEMATNTAKVTQDHHVLHDNILRSKCYQTAFDDVSMDEELKAMDRLATILLVRRKEHRLQIMSVEDYASLCDLLDEVERHRPK